MIKSIDFRPVVGTMKKWRYFPYQQSYALAEFVDNSIQSFLHNEEEIKKVDGDNTKIEITIGYDSRNEILTIEDNAAGINEANYARAFSTGEDPPDTDELAEFGMGMKVAACWYSGDWEVETTTIGESEKRIFRCDMSKLSDNMPVETIGGIDPNKHGTKITLRNLYRKPYGTGYSAIRNYLRNIYSWFLKNHQMKLSCLGQLLSVTEAPVVILHGPYRDNLKVPQEQWVTWKKDIEFISETGIQAKGFAAIAEAGRSLGFGFSLFRRGRMIKDRYMPESIFRKPSHQIYQRLFGELHLEGVRATFSKNDFDWNDIDEELFLKQLGIELDKDPKRLLYQASADYQHIRPPNDPPVEPPDDPPVEPPDDPPVEPPDDPPVEPPDDPPVEPPDIDVRHIKEVTIEGETRSVYLDKPIVYFHELPAGDVIKIGVTTVREYLNRVREAQRYFVDDVKPLGVIELETREDADNKERELLNDFGRTNQTRNKCELVWDNPNVRAYIDENCEDPRFYFEASRASS